MSRPCSVAPPLAMAAATILAGATSWERPRVWALVGIVAYVWLLLSLFGLHLRRKRAGASPWQISLRRLFLNVTVWCCVLSVLTTDWPLRLRFAASRGAIDALADEVQRGGQTGLPRHAGLFLVSGAETNAAGQPCLWTHVEPGGNTGFVRCPDGTMPQLNLRSSLPITDGWFLVTED